MSIASLGIIGGLAGTPLPQRAADTDKVHQDAGGRSRAADAAERAEAAAGIGQTEQDAEASERDADGRRPWEQQHRPKPEPSHEEPDAEPLRSIDPTGACGTQLDLSG